jgi:hypothetical protein
LANAVRREILGGFNQPLREEAMLTFLLAVVTVPFFHGKPINIWFGLVRTA